MHDAAGRARTGIGFPCCSECSLLLTLPPRPPQADYHQEKFKTFPHVNSPAWLIRHLVGKHQEAVGETGQQGVQEQ